MALPPLGAFIGFWASTPIVNVNRRITNVVKRFIITILCVTTPKIINLNQNSNVTAQNISHLRHKL